MLKILGGKVREVQEDFNKEEDKRVFKIENNRDWCLFG